MKTNLMKITVLLAALGLCFSGPFAYALTDEDGPGGVGYGAMGPQGSGPDEGGHGFHKRKGGPEAFFKELNLTPEQREKMKTQREAQREKTQTVRNLLKVKMPALHEEIAKPATDRAKINTLVAEINTLKGQLFAQHIEGILGMKEILTPEQFAKVQEKFKEHRERMEKKHPKWAKHRQGETESDNEQVPS